MCRFNLSVTNQQQTLQRAEVILNQKYDPVYSKSYIFAFSYKMAPAQLKCYNAKFGKLASYLNVLIIIIIIFIICNWVFSRWQWII
jgi:hypothetical protein